MWSILDWLSSPELVAVLPTQDIGLRPELRPVLRSRDEPHRLLADNNLRGPIDPCLHRYVRLEVWRQLVFHYSTYPLFSKEVSLHSLKRVELNPYRIFSPSRLNVALRVLRLVQSSMPSHRFSLASLPSPSKLLRSFLQRSEVQAMSTQTKKHPLLLAGKP